MSRRLLGPVGVPAVFIAVAALVFAGLGWLTVVALRVETAQREAAAEAELENKLRVALWQLDGRVLLQLGGEDGRPFHHYSSADPLQGVTAGPTPLLGAPLPEWMRLHVQLDPATGWDSPQVLPPDARERVASAWPELPLRNDSPDRALALSDLRAKYPVAATCGLLAARDHAIPADSLPFAAPLFTTDSWQRSAEPVATSPPTSAPKPPPPPELTPTTAAPDARSFFGWELPRREPQAANSLQPAVPREGAAPSAAPAPAGPPGATAPGVSQATNTRGSSRVADNDRGRDDFWNRAQTIQRATQEAKNAGTDPMYGKNYPGALQNNDVRNGVVPVSPTMGNEKGEKGASIGPAMTELDKIREALDQAKLAKDADVLQKRPGDRAGGASITERLAALRIELDRRRCLDAVDERCRAEAVRNPLLAAAWSIARGAGCVPAVFTPVGDARPVQSHGLGNALTNGVSQNWLVGPPVVNIHLGSMRPQWLTAADGTETLVLMRVAKLDNRTVYQGVVLDWPRLEALLKDEVKDQFPGATLVPVKNPDGVQPGRAMTALPVQLDPGPQPELPPGDWTALRFGLALAWAAAFVAVAAVGLSGWSLIDLAERRIRFVSAVTHELRTPLTSLRLYLDLLTSGMIHDEAKRQEYLRTLAVESERLHRLVDNVLDFARLEKRRRNGDLKPVRVAELLDQLKQTWADRVAAEGHELVVVSTLPPELEFSTDPVMVQQIVGNLIDNARKYARGAADRRIWLWAKGGGAGRVTFEVEDRGPGVPAGERRAIFKPFRRGSVADTTAGGAGLGLALAKQWAEVLGGTVAYRPADGAPGACFRLELPCR
ncbi:HAMP domain-containing histidine kinase [Gemmata sp. JC673]|uniref:histidine kinase n=1 Tax=Gemmata algarum TaxID=2975278 RepID=A0ABU5F8P2_9BACT|nr:HAMP domain-containing sensor histidine kinase [Gemmata algarum]MDY3563132.1 HAMP domain-containing histidine kinase [Gemmata algarum]